MIDINNKQDFVSMIDEIGELQDQMIALKERITNRLKLAEKWALANPSEAFGRGTSGATDKYDFRLVAAARAVKRQPGFDQAKIISLMRKDEQMKQFIYTAYDTKLIAKELGGSIEKRESVKPFGIFFTEPGKSHLEVG